MDKTLHRDLKNMCWRILINEIDILHTMIQYKHTITYSELSEIYERQLKQLDKIVFAIDEEIAEGVSLRFVDEIFKDNTLESLGNVRIDQLCVRLAKLKSYYKFRINK